MKKSLVFLDESVISYYNWKEYKDDDEDSRDI